jgi:hypothetical protein
MATIRKRDSADQDLGELDTEEDFTFPPAERKVVTQPVDMSVQTLSEQWLAKNLILPEIQREYVWDNGKASRLIESLILNIPVPVLYFAETADAKYEIIDGHQRVRSIARYLGNEFALSAIGVLREYKGQRYNQLPERERRFLLMRTLRVIVISIDSHPRMKFEIFERLNTGAISLNAQELRNSIYQGLANTQLHELANTRSFRKLIGTKLPRRRMVDEELILRFFSLRAGLGGYRPPLKKFLNDYMEESRAISRAELQIRKDLFDETAQMAIALFGPAAFRVTDAAGTLAESSINRALFDAQMLAASWVISVPKPKTTKAARRRLAALFGDERFLDSIQRATGDRARTLKRLRDTTRALTQAGISLSVPFDLRK